MNGLEYLSSAGKFCISCELLEFHFEVIILLEKQQQIFATDVEVL